MSTHILYLTSRCNFACTYCYEHKNGGAPSVEFSLTKEVARNQIDDIIKRERGEQTCVVLFGGEPTLNWDVLKDAVVYGYSKCKNLRFCMTTNAYRMRNMRFCAEVKKLVDDVNGQFTIEVSFDGIGNASRRTASGAKTDEHILAAIRNLKQLGLQYHLRYTVHALNMDVAAADISIISKTLAPSRIVPSYDTSNIGIEREARIKQDLRDRYISGDIAQPVCDLVCDICKQCTKNPNVDTLTYWANGMVRSAPTSVNAPTFKDF